MIRPNEKCCNELQNNIKEYYWTQIKETCKINKCACYFNCLFGLHPLRSNSSIEHNGCKHGQNMF